MVLYNFKKIQPVPPNKEFVDIVLTRTQRKTPTVVHASFAISRIREFYMRKVRFTQDTFHKKLQDILDQFPRLDDIHPFYADLINVLYDRDHYKLALGQVNTAKTVIDNISKDYIRLLKYGDSLFRCKQLKRAALGRMVTVMRKQGPTLEYLEEVRKHLARLPMIDPATRTLLVCGYPNVGKSSFMNKVTRADVEVQPYAFTTKSLFVGHMDYKYQRWQVIDTPGILDHPLEERNTIEMQSITALAHLQCAILYFLDISGQCGYSIDQQISLFNNISPLFVAKPLMVIATKIDVQPWDTLDEPHKQAVRDRVTCLSTLTAPTMQIQEMVKKSNALFRCMSNLTDDGVMAVRNAACDALLVKRLEVKMRSKKMGEVLNRLTVTVPKPRDAKQRDALIPPSVLAARAAKAGEASQEQADETMQDDDDEVMDNSGEVGSAPVVQKWLERDRERGGGGPGVYRPDLTRYYILRDEEWKTDMVPEIMDGKNVMDYVDPDIMERLEALEAEEEATLALEANHQSGDDEDTEEAAERKQVLKEIRSKIKIKIDQSRREKTKHGPILPRKQGPSAADATEHLMSLGLPLETAHRVIESAAAQKRGRSRTRHEDRDAVADMDIVEEGGDASERPRAFRPIKRARSQSRTTALEKMGVEDKAQRTRVAREKSRERSRSVAPKDGLPTPAVKQKLQKMVKKVQRVKFMGKQGESDRFIGTAMPRHLFSGKRGIGKTDRR